MRELSQQLRERIAFDRAKQFELKGYVRSVENYNQLEGMAAEHARLAPILELLVDVVSAVIKEFPCEEHDFEPNTTMDFFRCDKCGIRPHMDEALRKLSNKLKDGGGD